MDIPDIVTDQASNEENLVGAFEAKYTDDYAQDGKNINTNSRISYERNKNCDWTNNGLNNKILACRRLRIQRHIGKRSLRQLSPHVNSRMTRNELRRSPPLHVFHQTQ